ncbi:MAG: helix-turn-helix domain-containing protein [Lactobacillaceae bacterium]|nr:helix-turn-helix domain-containing protein [Lactobacillaceae bacterium]
MNTVISSKIKLIRKNLELSQEELSLSINVSRSEISKWERGVCVPNIHELIILSKLSGYTLDEICTEGDDRI